MDKKSKILIWIFVVLIIASVGVTFWRIMIKKDYIISAQTDCDPYAEKCFVWTCDPNSTVEGEACVNDPEKDIWYFQVVNRKAFNIPLCDPNAEGCEALVCPEGEADCSVDFCTEENMEGQYASSCNDPVKFTEENPIEEEVVCDPETEECPVAAEEGAEVAE
jgi:hypothetical protein